MNFQCKKTESIWGGSPVKGIAIDLQNMCRRKLRMLHAAHDINDLRVPPGNKLEALKENRKGQFSIRVNNQWRLCYRWDDPHCYDVHMINYH